MRKVFKSAAVIAFALLLLASYSFAQYVPTLEPTSSLSNTFSPKLSLKKKSFSPWENISLSYDGDPKALSVKLTNIKGEEIEFQGVLRDRDGKVLDIEIPKNIRPGKYHLLINDGETKLVDEDVFWGLTIANQRESVLKQGQVGRNDVVLFSQDGLISCEKDREAQLINIITNEEKKHPSPRPGECSQEKPNAYENIFQTENIGAYILKIKDEDSGQELVSAFDVVSSLAMETKREAPTFVKKDNEYAIKITLVANEDFDGFLTEELPDSLNPSDLNTADVRNPDALSNGQSTMTLALPFNGDYPITQHFSEEPDAETHLLEAYRAYGVKAHDGVDFAVPPATEIISVDDGEVTEIPDHAVAYGVTIVVQHNWGKSYYGHLSSQKVKPGDRIKKGDIVGLSGNTGLSTGPHLHFGIELNNPDLNNGYLGKLDPLESLSIKNKFKTSTKKLTWNVSAKKDETITIGYKIKLTDDSNYLLSGTRLTAKTKDDKTVHEDKNPWTYVVEKE